MEQLLTYWSAFLALLLPLLLLLLLKLKQPDSHCQRLPPGPRRLPVIGNLHQILSNPLLHRAMADLARRHNAPLMYLKLGELPVVVASSPEAAREVLKTNEITFATRPWSSTVKIMMSDGEGLVFARYGVLWRQLRKICVLELLSARRVQSLRHIREDEVGRLIAAVAGTPPGEPVNVSKRLDVLITDSAVRALIGDRFTRREEFLQELAKANKIISGFHLADLFPSLRVVNAISSTDRRAEAIHRKTFELMDSAIRQHQEWRAVASGAVENDEEDLVDVLLRIQMEGGLEVPLTMGNIKAVILDLFAAGSETSALTLQWAMSELMRNPRVMQKAQTELHDILQGKSKVTGDDVADLKYLKLVIKETLRLHPAAPLLVPRQSREPCNILGYDVPKDITVFVNAWAIGRDPRYWDDPEEFKPERFESGVVDFKGMNFEFIPFGAGRRMCPGMAFAEANIELALAALLYHFDWELPGGLAPGELDMAEEMGLTIRRKRDLYLHPTVRVPPPHAVP